MSKLEQFILFHLFKAPVLLLAASAVCVVVAGALHYETQRIQSLVQARARLDTELIEYNRHFLFTNSSVESMLTAFQIACRTVTNRPVQLELDYEAAKNLEKVGLLITAAQFENGHLTVTLKDYPEAK